MPVPSSPTSPQTFEVPNPFGRRYKLLRKLGQGGMGTVYLAEDTHLGRLVALKVPRDLAGIGAELVARFRREAQVLAGLNHPNICRVYDVGEFDGELYLTMEYHEGRSLDQVLVAGQPMPPRKAAHIIRTLALAMQQAHDRAIVHRDLKPANVLVTTENTLVILDFGLARRVSEGETLLTLPGDTRGTPEYMAPEQVNPTDPSAIGRSCDIYSLGVMLYEMLSGRKPFIKPRPMVFAEIVNDPPPLLTSLTPGLDPALEAICLKALEKQPSARHATMAAFAVALSRWLATAPPRAVDPEGARPGEERDDNALRLKLCWCPAGTFRMGSPPTETGRYDNEAQVDVTLPRGFWLGKYEVTQEQWREVMGTSLAEQRAKGSFGNIVGDGPNHPMYHVNHAEAVGFCRKLTESERAAGRLPAGWEYRLPTEAEWEYACRAGNPAAYSFGGDPADLAEYAWYGENSGNQTHPVGRKKPNAFGLHDMHGNVWEWCLDGYDAKLVGGADPVGPLDVPYRVFRGGGWFNTAGDARSADRSWYRPVLRSFILGFRVARVPSVR